MSETLEHTITRQRVAVKRGDLGGHGLREWTCRDAWLAVGREEGGWRLHVHRGGEQWSEVLEHSRFVRDRVRELGYTMPVGLDGLMWDCQRGHAWLSEDYGEVEVGEVE